VISFTAIARCDGGYVCPEGDSSHGLLSRSMKGPAWGKERDAFRGHVPAGSLCQPVCAVREDRPGQDVLVRGDVRQARGSVRKKPGQP